MNAEIVSFHGMREACLAGAVDGWCGFLRAYAPLGRHLLERHFRELDVRELLADLFRGARAEENAFWQSFTGAGEKEFLFHFLRLVMMVGRRRRGETAETPLTPENLWSVLGAFPFLQREMLLLALRSYGPQEISQILKFSSDTIVSIRQQALEKFRASLGAGPLDEDFFSRDHDPLFAQIEQGQTEHCIPEKTYVRIEDGQITWREREAAEQHIGNCLYCLNRSANYKELHHYFRVLAPADGATVASLAAVLGLPMEAAAPTKRSLWQRWLGRRES
jgi:hypothetical protein